MKDAATEITPSTSQRDISTQVTPAPSFHAAVTPPRIHNGGPARLNTTPVHSERRPASVGVDVTELKNCHEAKLELDQAATLDTNWATREEEVEESSKSLRLSVSRSVDFKEVKRNVLEARASAWEEAEQSKYMARYDFLICVILIGWLCLFLNAICATAKSNSEFHSQCPGFTERRRKFLLGKLMRKPRPRLT